MDATQRSNLETIPAGTTTENPRTTDCPGGGVVAVQSGADDFRGPAWIDPTSTEALGRTVDPLKTLGVLLIVTYRPEFEPPWIGRPHVTALTLNRLGEREIAAMIDGITGNKALPRASARTLSSAQTALRCSWRKSPRRCWRRGAKALEQTSPQRFRLLPWPSPQPPRLADGAA